MRNLFIIGLLSALTFGCSDKDKLPPGVLPKKQMREVMWDMIRAGEFLHGFVFKQDSSLDKIKLGEKWFDKVYQLHKITKTQFEKSYAYYNSRPVLMKEMLDSLAKKPAYPGPVVRDTAPLRDSIRNSHKANQIPRNDTLRKPSDALRKKIIKNRKSLLKAV